MCVSALKIAILLNCPQINPVGLKIFIFKTSTTSHAGNYPYGKCKHVDCVQGDLRERGHEL